MPWCRVAKLVGGHGVFMLIFCIYLDPPLDLEALVLCGARWLDFCPASDSRDLSQSFAFKLVDALGPDASVALHRHLQDFCQR
ncbi:MAG: hypothetical protein ACPG9P_04565 [Candidatus Pseudothioglobus sp.]